MSSALSQIWTPHPGQRAFLEADQRYRVLACGRRWGKTDACAVAVIEAMLSTESSRQLLLAPTQAQAEILLERVAELWQAAFPNSSLRRRQTPYPSIAVGEHRVWARSGHVPRSLRGQGATHIVVDEAAFVPESLITEIALPMLATSHGRLTLLSTPCGRNHFWRFFQRGQRGEPDFWSRQSPSAESPLIRPDFLAIQRELLPERAYRVEYEADFLDSSGRVFRAECVEACLVPTLPDLSGAPITIGIDWARYGDYTAVAAVQGARPHTALLHLERFHQMTWTEQVERVAQLIQQFPGARVIVDATGLGDPVQEMLQQRLPAFRIEPFVFTSLSKHQVLEALVLAIERRQIVFPPHPDLLRELEHFEAEPSSSGRPKLRAGPGAHDDLVIALSLALAHTPYACPPRLRASGDRHFRHSVRKPYDSFTQFSTPS